MNIDFEEARRYYGSREFHDSYEERQRRRTRNENQRYDRWAREMERREELEQYKKGNKT